MKSFTRNALSCIPAAAFAFAIAPFANIKSANAACAPAAPVTDSVVTCTGTTNNQNNPDGFGTGQDNRNTIDVELGASVTGTNAGLRLSNATPETINNSGTISGGTRGIAGFGGTFNNSGIISGIGANSQGIETFAFGFITNSGTISGGSIGVQDQNGTLTNTSTGTISGGTTGVVMRDKGQTSDTATVTNAGMITGGSNGIFFLAQTSNAIGDVSNSGSASATAADGVGILFNTVQGAVRNSGTIQAAAAGGIAIQANDANVTNNGGGTISGRFAGIQAGGIAAVNNAKDAVIEATEPSFGANAISGFGVSVQNSGEIRALGASAAAIVAGDGGATVDNTRSGVISGTRAAISARGALTVTGNEGRIEANSASSFTIVGQSDVSVSNGSIGTIRAFGQNSLAIASSGTATVENGGGLIQTFDQGSTTIFGNNVKVTSNTGIIGASGLDGIAIRANTTADVTNNSGGIIESRANNGTTIASNGTVTVANNGGLIQALGQNSSTISGTNVKITGNNGTIEATGINGFAVFAADTADVTNSRTIQSTGDGGTAIHVSGNAVINNNAGASIVGNSRGILLTTGTINNAGTISSTKPNNGSATILVGTSATVTNTGAISAESGSFGIDARSARVDLVNSGTISTSGTAFGIAAGNANVTNTGTIDTGSNSIFANTANIQNLGTISSANSAVSIQNGVVGNLGTIQASANSINIGNGTVSNAGSISGATGIHPVTFAMIGNSGMIQGIGSAGFGIFADNSANVLNAGTISGNIGIQANGLNNAGTVITNAGTIEGTGGTAIKLSPAADTLTLLPRSRIIGLIDMGGGADTININNIVPASRVSSLTTLLPVNAILQNVINFTGTVNAAPVSAALNMPSVASQTQFATLDPTAFGQADRTIMSFTGGISSLVRGRLGGSSANGSAVQVVSFAPAGARGRTEEAFSAMAYAAERTTPLTHPFTYADAPYNVWTSGFGGTSTQKGDNTMLRSVASAGAGVIGVDRQMRPDLLVGAFAGGGTSRLSVELNSQSIDTDYVTGGVYGRFDWVSHFLDFTLQGGATTNKSKRLVLNDTAPGGSETATASYDSWYISPEIAYGRRYHFADGYTLTPVGRIRYLAGTFDGYNEAGSAQNLIVGRRTLNDLEERAEAELSKITGVGAGSFRTSVHGGLIALQRLGNPTINTVLIGQDLSFTTPGKASTAGVVAGAGFDFRATDHMSLFGAFEVTLMSDHSRTAAGKAGLKFAF